MLMRLVEGPGFENHWLLLLAGTVLPDAIRCSLNGKESSNRVFGHLNSHTALYAGAFPLFLLMPDPLGGSRQGLRSA